MASGCSRYEVAKTLNYIVYVGSIKMIRESILWNVSYLEKVNVKCKEKYEH